MAPKTPKKLTPKEELFVAEYLISLNASDAYRKAGYKGKNADVIGPRMLGKVGIAAAIAEGKAKRSEQLEINANWVLTRLANIVDADPNEMTKVVVGCCRYCHGVDHAYQWRTEDEFEAAKEEYWELSDDLRAKGKEPKLSGGFGFDSKRAPHPNCPQCDGDGRPKVLLGDTTKLSEQGRTLYAGVKQSKSGVEVKFQDKMKAIEMIARHIDFYGKETEHAAGALATAITEIQQRMSKAPIRRDTSQDDKS